MPTDRYIASDNGIKDSYWNNAFLFTLVYPLLFHYPRCCIPLKVFMKYPTSVINSDYDYDRIGFTVKCKGIKDLDTVGKFILS